MGTGSEIAAAEARRKGAGMPPVRASTDTGRPRASIAGIGFDCLTEDQVVREVTVMLRQGRGGWIATPNIDICRAARRDPALCNLVSGASFVVPDGMPLLWASRVLGNPLPARVTGASLIFSLSRAAGGEGRSVYLLGGAEGVPEKAAQELSRRFPGLRLSGAYAPPAGFEMADGGVSAIRDRLLASAPDIVYVGLGFPRQERLIAELAPALPGTWFLACGAAIPFAAGAQPRAPRWMQRSGTEWLFRLASEPRRLFRRYLIDDLPFAVALMASSVVHAAAARIISAKFISGASWARRRARS